MRRHSLSALLLFPLTWGCGSSESPSKVEGAETMTEGAETTTEPPDTTTEPPDTTNAPPSIAPLSDVLVQVGELLEISVAATDLDDDPLTYSGESLPDGAAVDPGTGTLTWTPEADDVGIHEGLLVVASDGRLSASAALTISVATDTLVVVPLPAISDERLAPDANAPSDPDALLRITAAPGEHEPARLALFALADQEDLALEIPDLEGLENTLPAASIDVRTVKLWWQAGTDHAKTDQRVLVPELLLKDDSLVRTVSQDNEVRSADGTWLSISNDDVLNERVAVEVGDFDVSDNDDFVPIDISGGSNKQLWLTLSLADDQAPGIYTGTAAVTSGGSPIAWVPLEIEVLPIDLPPSELTYSIYYRAELSADWPDGTISSEYKSYTQLTAELESMAAHGIITPTVYQAPDDPYFEDVLTARVDAGMAEQPLYLVRGSAQFLGRSVEELQTETLATIATARIYGATDVYFMGRDEARGEELSSQREPWEAVREVDGKVFAAGYRTTSWKGVGNYDLMGDIQDLLVCAYRPSAQEAALWHSQGQQIFSYENPQGGLELPELYRRNFGLLLWQNDFDGVMTYAFQDSFGHGWNDFDHETKRDFNFAYPTSDGVIDTIQYEGLREAVDDTRYLAALYASLATASAAGKDVSVAEAWLEELKAAPLARMELDEIRDQMIGWTLHFTDQTVSGGPALAIEDLRVSPVTWPPSVTVEWTTSRRATSQLLYSASAEPESSTTEEPALVRHHRVTLRSIDPDELLDIRVRSVDGDGNEVVSELIPAGPGTVTSLVLASPTPADGATVLGEVTVAADLSSTWAASAIIDWDDSLLGWWRFSEPSGEAAADSSSWDRTGSMVGDAGDRTDGWSGSGLWLNGVDQYVEVGDLGVPENGRATVEGWFRFDQLAVDQGGSAGLFGAAYVHPVNDHIYFRSTNDWFRSSSHITPGAWHHMAIAWDGDTSTAQLWIDGEALPINVQSDPEEIVALDDFNIGAGAGYFGGTVDELRVWGRVLSEAEVRAAYDVRRYGLQATFAAPPAGTTSYTVTAIEMGDDTISETRTVLVE